MYLPPHVIIVSGKCDVRAGEEPVSFVSITVLFSQSLNFTCCSFTLCGIFQECNLGKREVFAVLLHLELFLSQVP
jgi:hypothetical protein